MLRAARCLAQGEEYRAIHLWRAGYRNHTIGKRVQHEVSLECKLPMYMEDDQLIDHCNHPRCCSIHKPR